ncbi:MAG: DUF262 domain-containing protein [Aestuariivita sp.]|nr:DUF262 domain-containing protein [Aestuariivita sp.]
MSDDNSDPCALLIKDLLKGENQYIIPIYQRNYAWGQREIEQLILDIIDSCRSGLYKCQNYYIGTLVVSRKKNGKYEVIDGQQRLTTLSLLASYLKNKVRECGAFRGTRNLQLVIDFESRKQSRETLEKIFNGEIVEYCAKDHGDQELNSAILNGYKIVEDYLSKNLDQEEGIKIEKFSAFLFEKIQIMQVEVPKDTDLNHYFEIMNNRGEQLEKHEILKSTMMKALKSDKNDQKCLHLIWEACANMEKYVQMGFSPAQRDAIFGDDWNSFDMKKFEDFQKKIELAQKKIDLAVQTRDDSTKQSQWNDDELKIDQIINDSKFGEEGNHTHSSEIPERFNSAINFPHFLLHVLQIHTRSDVSLNDRRLIQEFDSQLFDTFKDVDRAKAVKDFAFSLLHCKFLFDQYIIKRDFGGGKEKWSLKCLESSGNGTNDPAKKVSYRKTFGDRSSNKNYDRILMLLSAFHVSAPALSNKHWLSAALNHLFTAEKIEMDIYLEYMENVAKSFIFDRFLDKELRYFTIIFKRNGKCKAMKEDVKMCIDEKLSYDNIGNIFVFNFLDYLLWRKYAMKDRVKKFEFTFRSSVEHFYPQHPWKGYAKLEDSKLHSFGNLCLISHSKNSRLGNSPPGEKQKHYEKSSIDSVKQYLMMEESKKREWWIESIDLHLKEVKDALLDTLESKERRG